MTESLPFDSGDYRAVPPTTPTSISHRVRAASRLVHVTVAGDVTIEALHAARDAIVADPAYAPGMNVYVDCRVITSTPSADDIRSLALSALFSKSEAHVGRVAIVATTQRSYEAASLFELFIDAPKRLALFTDAGQARAWLATDAPTSF